MSKKPPADKNVLHDVIRVVMEPLVRLLLRYGVAYSDFASIARKVYVEVADAEFLIENKKQSVARVAVLTGLTRREVKSILEEPDLAAPPMELNRAGRVASAWLRDRTFWENNEPAALSIRSKKNNSFHALVKKYGGDIPARSVLDELLSCGAIEKDGDLVHITSTGYVPSDDSSKLLKVSFRNVGDLIRTIDHNDQHSGEESLLQLTVEYDNVSEEGADAFRILSREKSKEILLYLDRFLATQDKDTNHSLQSDKSVRTGLGIFYFHDTEGLKAEKDS